MDFVRKIGKHTVLYGLSSIVGRVMNYLLVPLHTRILTPYEAGAITELYIYAAILNVFYLFSMDITYFRFAKELDERRAFHISSRIVAGSSILLSLILYFGVKQYYFHISGVKTSSLLLFIIILFSDSFSNLFLARLRYNNKAGLFSAIQILRILINIILNILFLYGDRIYELGIFKDDILSDWLQSNNNFIDKIILANLFSSIFILIISQVLNLRSLYVFKIFQSKDRLRVDNNINENFYEVFLKFASPLVLVGIVGLLNELISRPMLKYLLPRGFYPGYSSQDILGIYASCYKLSIFMNLAVQAFRYAAEPLFFKHNEDLDNFRSSFNLFIIFSSLILVGVSLNLDLISVIMLGEKYRIAKEIVPFLLLSYSFFGAYFSFSIWFKIKNKTIYSLVISTFSLLILIILNIYLIPNIGYWGCIVSQLISFGSMAILGYIISSRLVVIQYDFYKAFRYLVLTLALISLYRIFIPHSFILRIPLGLILSLGYFLLVLFLERNLIFQLFNKRFQK